MGLEDLFIGNALSAVDAKGRLSVPAFIRGMIERRSEARTVVIGVHSMFPCLSGYDRPYARHLYEDNERRRLADEAAGVDPAEHFARIRRDFGMTEEVPYDTSGRIILPPMMRRKGEIEDYALFIGAAGTFEIWNPRHALKADDANTREIAAYRLEEKGIAL